MRTQLPQNSAVANDSATETQLRITNRRSPLRFGARLVRFTPVFLAVAVAVAAPGPGGAGSSYSAKAGRIAFSVGSNIPFLNVSGASTLIAGTGEGALVNDTATVRNLRFEVDPKSFKTGMKIRDDHLYDKVFKTADGSFPSLILKADHFEAKLNPATSKWEGTLDAQLTMHGVTKPISLHASLEKKGKGALVSADGSVKTSDFGVAKIAYSGAVMEDKVAISISNLRVEP
jgi:polyisoprenoid-binding protein YceI